MANVKFMDVPSGSIADKDYALIGNSDNGVRKVLLSDIKKMITDEYKFSPWKEADWSTATTSYKPNGAHVYYRYNKLGVVQISGHLVEATDKFAINKGNIVAIAQLPQEAMFVSNTNPGVSTSGESVVGSLGQYGNSSMGMFTITGNGAVMVKANFDGADFFVEYVRDYAG